LLINPAEECPTCGSLLSKTLKRELKSEQKQQLLQQQSSSSLLLPKFKTAYEEFDSRLTFDIEKIDNSISLRAGEGSVSTVKENTQRYFLQGYAFALCCQKA
jgi:hypothetical protein